MPTIQTLPDDLASQIAAGEVVERPASVVKELIENSLDAEATRVIVKIRAGGLRELSVIDDGIGMAPDDAKLCFGRHATSKLAAFADLEQLRTFGFRGEALPSIASVSRLTLVTRTRDQNEAICVRANFGKIEAGEQLGAATGTHISVEELFANVPARLKFLRSTNTEAAHVTEVFTQMALGRPQVAFILERDGKEVRHFPRVKSRKGRAEQVLDGHTLVAVAGSRGPLHVEAFLTPPGVSRQGASGLRFVVNGRSIRDRALSGAVAHAYGQGLGPGRYPTGVVYLDLPPALVDINVHPQKLEVRFADPRAVTEALHSLVSKGLGAPKVESHEAQSSAPRAPIRAPIRNEHFKAATEHETRLDRATKAVAEGDVARAPSTPPPSQPTLDVAEPSSSSGRLRFLAQLQKSYLLAEGPDGIYIVDQHRAASRALAQRLRRAYEEGSIRAQTLLFPITLALTPREVASLGEAADSLLRFGLDARVRAEEVVSLHSLPELLKHAAPETLLRLVAQSLNGSSSPKQGVEYAILAVSAAFCIKAGETITAFSAQGLLNSMEDNSPEGRRNDHSILLRIGFDELERKLGQS
jgi:DNA mismatch repair protein MutL